MTTRAERIGMRTFNDGRFLETELKLLGDGDGLTWGFALGTDPWQGSRAHAKDEQAGPEHSITSIEYINTVYIKCLCL